MNTSVINTTHRSHNYSLTLFNVWITVLLKRFCQSLAANDAVSTERCYLASLLATHELRDRWHSEQFIQTTPEVRRRNGIKGGYPARAASTRTAGGQSYLRGLNRSSMSKDVWMWLVDTTQRSGLHTHTLTVRIPYYRAIQNGGSVAEGRAPFFSFFFSSRAMTSAAAAKPSKLSGST